MREHCRRPGLIIASRQIQARRKHEHFLLRDRQSAAVGAKPQPWLKTQFQEGWGAVSPHGRWAAYHSNETGRNEIYVQGYPELRGKRQVSQAGGDYPRWSRDGRELYWLDPGRTSWRRR
jgi:hypothetical protein